MLKTRPRRPCDRLVFSSSVSKFPSRHFSLKIKLPATLTISFYFGLRIFLNNLYKKNVITNGDFIVSKIRGRVNFFLAFVLLDDRWIIWSWNLFPIEVMLEIAVSNLGNTSVLGSLLQYIQLCIFKLSSHIFHKFWARGNHQNVLVPKTMLRYQYSV